MIEILFAGVMVIGLLFSLIPTNAQRRPSVAGNYMCDLGCGVTHSSVQIEISGARAICKNETGALSHGDVVSDRSIRCFGKIGTLSEDGERVKWDDGTTWERDHTGVF